MFFLMRPIRVFLGSASRMFQSVAANLLQDEPDIDVINHPTKSDAEAGTSGSFEYDVLLVNKWDSYDPSSQSVDVQLEGLCQAHPGPNFGIVAVDPDGTKASVFNRCEDDFALDNNSQDALVGAIRHASGAN